MSYTEEELKNTVRKAVQEALMAERSQVAGQNSQQGEHHHSMEAIDDCPNCRTTFGVDKFKAKTISKAWEERKGLHMKCKNCGLPVKTKRDGFTDETQDKACPNCGSPDAKERYAWE